MKIIQMLTKQKWYGNMQKKENMKGEEEEKQRKKKKKGNKENTYLFSFAGENKGGYVFSCNSTN